MKIILICMLSAAVPLWADSPAEPLAPPPAANATSSSPTAATPAAAGDDAVAHEGYSPGRYQSLWTKSPFAVETQEEATVESTEYILCGVSQFEGVTYASLVEKQNQNHHFISSSKVTDGMQLTSVTRKENGDTVATLVRDGVPMTLKLETPPMVAGTPAGVGGMVPGSALAVPSAMPAPAMIQNIPMPGSQQAERSLHPTIRFHRPIIRMPPRPQPEAAPANPPPANASANASATPPAGSTPAPAQ